MQETELKKPGKKRKSKAKKRKKVQQSEPTIKTEIQSSSATNVLDLCTDSDN